MVRTYKAIIVIEEDSYGTMNVARAQAGLAQSGAIITSWEDVTPRIMFASTDPVVMEPTKGKPWPSWLPPVSEAPEWAIWLAVDRDNRAWWWECLPHLSHGHEWDNHRGEWWSAGFVRLPEKLPWTEAIWRIPGK